MTYKGGVEALNTFHNDLRGFIEVIGGVTVLLVGDFKQVLPVVTVGIRTNAVGACLEFSHLLPNISKLSSQLE